MMFVIDFPHRQASKASIGRNGIEATTRLAPSVRRCLMPGRGIEGTSLGVLGRTTTYCHPTGVGPVLQARRVSMRAGADKGDDREGAGTGDKRSGKGKLPEDDVDEGLIGAIGTWVLWAGLLAYTFYLAPNQASTPPN